MHWGFRVSPATRHESNSFPANWARGFINEPLQQPQQILQQHSLGICSGFAVRLNVCTIRDISQHFYPFDFFLLSFIVCWFFSFSHLYWHVVGLQRTATVAVVVSVCLSAPQQYDQRLPPTPSPSRPTGCRSIDTRRRLEKEVYKYT